MNWTEIEVSKLQEADYNPRTITKDKLELLKHSLDKDPEFIKGRPLLVNQRDGKLIVFGGNQRLKAARELMWQKIPCVLYKVSLAQEKLWNIKDNKEYGEWDDDKFPVMLKEVYEGELDYTLTGFDGVEVEKHIRGLYEPKDELDVVPNLPDEAKSTRGEIYQLGNHRIMCGDSTVKEDVDKLLDGNKVDMVFTDPPYGIDIAKGKTIGNQNLAKIGVYKPMKGDENTDAAIKSYKLCVELGIKDMIWWGANYYANALPNSSGWIVWDKGRRGLTFADCEIAWTSQNTPSRIFYHLWDGMRRDSEHGNKRIHPTQKPIALAIECITLFENPKIIYDPFLGSGSTLIACEETKRTCIGMEIDPRYIDVIIQRWEEYTGMEAEKIN